MSSPVPIPALPALLERVCLTAQHPDTGPRDLAAVIATDDGFAQQLVAAVNTEFFSPRHPVADVPRAVGMLGLDAAVSMVVALTARRLVPVAKLGAFPVDAFWQASVRRGVAAQLLGLRLGLADHFVELFTLGFCLDLGVLLRVRACPQEAPFWDLSSHARERLAAERQGGDAHDKLGLLLFHRWRLPARLAVPVRYHHEPALAPKDHRLRAAIACAAEHVADVMAVDDKAEGLERLEDALSALRMGPEVIEDLIDDVADAAAGAEEAFSVPPAEQPRFAAIAEQACQRRSMVQLKREELSRQLASAVVERDRLLGEVDRLRLELARCGLVDPLTGAGARQALVQRLQRELGQSPVLRTGFSLLLLGPDGLGAINERYGHHTGDQILRRIAEVVRGALREQDHLYRFVGAQLAVLCLAADEQDATRVAERLRRVVAGRVRSPHAADSSPLTVSVGAVVVGPQERASADLVLHRACQALAAARRDGPNRVSLTPQVICA